MRITRRCVRCVRGVCHVTRCAWCIPLFTRLRKHYRASRSLVAGFLVLSGFAFGSQAEGVKDQAPQTLQGRVEFVELEGGYYQLTSAEGIQLRPVNFHNWPGCHKHGMLVSGVFKYRSAGRSFYMDGASPVELLELTCKESVEAAK